jgi:hypothetical protein
MCCDASFISRAPRTQDEFLNANYPDRRLRAGKTSGSNQPVIRGDRTGIDNGGTFIQVLNRPPASMKKRENLRPKRACQPLLRDLLHRLLVAAKTLGFPCILVATTLREIGKFDIRVVEGGRGKLR